MQYLDLKIVSQQPIEAVYSRVSTAQQDIKKQILMAEAFINNNNINKDSVMWFEDNDVSANKISMDERPALRKLRALIKQRVIKNIIVYSRDRLARNFYEYVALIKEIYQYDVNVIFTSSQQPPFSKVLAIESLYGIFAQSEGKNIVGRTSDASKQFPSSIFGFIRSGHKKNVTYTPNDKVVLELRSFFYDVKNANSSEDLYKYFMKYKKIFKNKSYVELLKYLQNPFYSGHMKTQFGYEKLQHVKPLITLEEYLDLQDIIQNRKDEILTAISYSGDRAFTTPFCHMCKSEMKFKASELGKSGYYICKKKHIEIKINVDVFNNLLTNQLETIINNIPVEKLKKDVFQFLLTYEKSLVEHKSFLDRKSNQLQKELTKSFGLNKKISLDHLIESCQLVKEEYTKINLDLIKIEDARKGINDLIRSIRVNLANEILKYDLNFLITLFFYSVEVSSDSLIYHISFGKYFESGDLIEFRA